METFGRLKRGLGDDSRARQPGEEHNQLTLGEQQQARDGFGLRRRFRHPEENQERKTSRQTDSSTLAWVSSQLLYQSISVLPPANDLEGGEK